MCWELRLTAFQPCIILIVWNTSFEKNKEILGKTLIGLSAYFKQAFVITITPSVSVITGKLAQL